MVTSYWKQSELIFLIVYALGFYAIVIHQSLQLSHDHHRSLFGLRPGWISNRLNDLSDAQWRNFRGNLPVLTLVLGMFTLVANALRSQLHLKGRGMSVIWFFISLSYLSYLHGACVVYILAIASMNFILVKIFAKSTYFSCILWIFNIFVLIWNRIYEGYSFSVFGQSFAFLDSYRGTFRWHICFNFVILRMISFGFDYHWALKDSRFDHKKHMQRCNICSSGKTCYLSLQEKSIQIDKFSFITYLSYLVYAPLYIAGPIISFNAFASQLEVPQKNYSIRQVAWYGFRWVLSLLLMEFMTHFFYYNAFVISGSWRRTSPFAVFIVGYGVTLNYPHAGIKLHVVEVPFDLALFPVLGIGMFIGLGHTFTEFPTDFVLFPLGPQIGGIEAPENMPRCINNCYNLESFWKNWHASFNKWLVRYMYIPLGGSQRKVLNVWFIFTFVAIWHDLEWKLLSWAWLTCLFFIPEMIAKSVVTTLQAKSAINDFVLRELSAVAGALTITCLMITVEKAFHTICFIASVSAMVHLVPCCVVFQFIYWVLAWMSHMQKILLPREFHCPF